MNGPLLEALNLTSPLALSSISGVMCREFWWDEDAGTARAVVTSHSLAMAPSDSISGTLSQSDRLVDGVDDLRCTTRCRWLSANPPVRFGGASSDSRGIY